MYVTHVQIQNKSNNFSIKNPTWEQVKDTILSLNGDNLNTVFIEKEYDDGEKKGDIKDYMTIAGGGTNRLYICTIFSHENFPDEISLYDPSQSWDETARIVHIFPGDYPMKLCLNLDSILVAAETYSRFGLRDKSLNWGYSPILKPL